MDKQAQSKVQAWHIWLGLAVALVVAALLEYPDERTLIPYSEFQQYLKAGQIDEVSVGHGGIEGKLKKALPDGHTRFATVRVDPDMANELDKYSVKYTAAIENTWLSSLLGWLLPTLLLVAIWAYALRRMGSGPGVGGGFLSIGKSKAKVYMETAIKVTFNDVAGVDEAKEELSEVVNFLKDPRSYSRLGARIPKGVLLVGPPGTGKTLLARAVAGEAGVPFFSINGSEFVEMFVGVGAARVRDLFEQARASAPAIIFIDELDALGRARGAFPYGGGADEKEQTLNQLLSEMDGFDPTGGLILLAATNRPEILDPALLRAGRFDRQVLVDRPDKNGRVQILHIHLAKIRLAEGVHAEEIAALTPGFSGADLANLVNEAALLATRRGGETSVRMEDFTQAVERIVAGLEKKNRLMNPNERQYVAYHEMGHALVALALPGSDPVHKISIIPRGIGALGYTIQRPTEDRYLMTQAELQSKMAVLLGGRAAEQLVFGHYSTGAADDLAKVTDIARNMVMRYGMYEPFGGVSFEEERLTYLPNVKSPEVHTYSEETAHEIDCAVRDFVKRGYTTALEILSKHRGVLDAGANRLLQKETLGADDLMELAQQVHA